MAFDNTVTIVGNVTRDPELRFLNNGSPVASFGVAWNNRYKDRNGEQVEETSFFDVTCWRDLANNVAESISKGDRVIVYGRLDQRSWETQDGDKRSKIEIQADDVAPSLKWATATVTRTPRDGNGAQRQPAAAAAPSGPAGDGEEPF